VEAGHGRRRSASTSAVEQQLGHESLLGLAERPDYPRAPAHRTVTSTTSDDSTERRATVAAASPRHLPNIVADAKMHRDMPTNRLTPGEVALIEAVQQLPPFRQLDRWWRRRSWRAKALWYAIWAVTIVVAVLLESWSSTRREQSAVRR
jgi:hypothetical protein